MSTEQKPTAEAVRVATEIADGVTCLQRHKLIGLISTTITAKDAEIERLRESLQQSIGIATHTEDAGSEVIGALKAEVEKLREQNQQQRALLVRACEMVTSIRDDRYFQTTLEINRFLSTPDVVELLKEAK